jgi:hypothetical protein
VTAAERLDEIWTNLEGHCKAFARRKAHLPGHEPLAFASRDRPRKETTMNAKLLIASALVAAAVAAPAHAGTRLNGLPFNGLPFNGLPFNGLPFNGLPFNGFSLNGADLRGATQSGPMFSIDGIALPE